MLVTAGIVIYSESVSPGNFAHQGQWPLAALFAVLLVLAAVGTVAMERKSAVEFGTAADVCVKQSSALSQARTACVRFG